MNHETRVAFPGNCRVKELDDISADIRHPETNELTQVRHLVEDVMRQVYNRLLDGRSLVPRPPETWSNRWIVVIGADLVGAGMIREDLVSDQWLQPIARGKRLAEIISAVAG